MRDHGRFEAIRDHQYDMVARSWSRATCRRRIIQLNRFGKWLVKRGRLKANPLDDIEIPRRVKTLPKILRGRWRSRW